MIRSRMYGRSGGRTALNRQTRRTAFTLIETALATIIVGVGVLAMVTAQTTFLQQNSWSTRASVAERLANEIREMTLNMPRHDPVTDFDPDNWTLTWGPEDNEGSVDDYDDLDDFDGVGDGTEFSAALGNGPIDARRRVIPNMEGWAQIIEVFNTDPYDMTLTDDDIADGGSRMMMMRVSITYQGPNDAEATLMTQVQWVAPQ